MKQHSFSIVLVGQGLLKDGIDRILRAENFRIISSVAKGDELIDCQVRPGRTLFLIVHTGDDFNAAIAQIESLRNLDPNAPVAVVTTRYLLDEMVAAFRAGVNGYFVDGTSCEVFAKSVELLMMGETIFPPALSSFALVEDDESRRDQDRTLVKEAGNDPQLSPREKTILRCLVEGDSNKCIARRIDIAEATVKVHIKAILRKIRVHNRTQAAIWGLNHAFLADEPTGSVPSSITRANGAIPALAMPANDKLDVKAGCENTGVAATLGDDAHSLAAVINGAKVTGRPAVLVTGGAAARNVRER